jgi:hypothetical protein
MAPLAVRMRKAVPAKRRARERSLRSRSEVLIALALRRKNVSEEDTAFLRSLRALTALRALEFELLGGNLFRPLATFIMGRA